MYPCACAVHAGVGSVSVIAKHTPTYTDTHRLTPTHTDTHQEEGMYTLVSELCKAAEDPTRRLGVVRLVLAWAPGAKAELQEHVGAMLLVR